MLINALYLKITKKKIKINNGKYLSLEVDVDLKTNKIDVDLKNKQKLVYFRHYIFRSDNWGKDRNIYDYNCQF